MRERAKVRSSRGIRPTRLRREPGNEPVSVKALAMTLPAHDWLIVAWRDDTNTELSSNFAAVRVRPAHGVGAGFIITPA